MVIEENRVCYICDVFSTEGCLGCGRWTCSEHLNPRTRVCVFCGGDFAITRRGSPDSYEYVDSLHRLFKYISEGVSIDRDRKERRVPSGSDLTRVETNLIDDLFKDASPILEHSEEDIPIERIPAHEEYWGVSLEGITAKIEYDPEEATYAMTVFGDARSLGKGKLQRDIEIVLTVFDDRKGVIGRAHSVLFKSDFFEFDSFKIHILDLKIQPHRARLVPSGW